MKATIEDLYYTAYNLAYGKAVTSRLSLGLTGKLISAKIDDVSAQAYAVDGRDQYNNSLGDVTSTTTFSIAPNGSCTGASCTASTAGAHTVTGTKTGKTGSASLQVSAGTIDHIVISPATATIPAGGSQSYTAQAFDMAGNPTADVTAFTTFSISPNGSCLGATCTEGL